MSKNFYDTQVCTNTVLQCIEWLDLALENQEPYHMSVAKDAIENDPNFQWKGVDKKLRRKYNYRYNKLNQNFKNPK